MNRRDMLKLSGVAAGFAAVPALAGAKGRDRVAVALFNARFGPARRFAEAARRRGITAVDTGGDVPSLLHGTLRDHALSGFAGVTTYADMVVIAAIAAQARRRFAVRISHLVEGDSVEHRLVDGPPASLELLVSAGQAWPEGCWDLVAGEVHAGMAASSPVAAHRATLWSWAIA